MKKYSAEHAKAIISSYAENWIEFRDDGVHYSPDIFTYDLGQELIWKYVLELDGDDAPDPLTAPCLPFPFTAHELAAFMLDGIGAASIPANYAGSWESGPDSGMLYINLELESRQALREAYSAIHAAEKAIGSSYPLELLKEVDRLGDEGMLDPLDKDIWEQHQIAKKRYREAFATWLKEMVIHLLNNQSNPVHEHKESKLIIQINGQDAILVRSIPFLTKMPPDAVVKALAGIKGFREFNGLRAFYIEDSKVKQISSTWWKNFPYREVLAIESKLKCDVKKRKIKWYEMYGFLQRDVLSILKHDFFVWKDEFFSTYLSVYGYRSLDLDAICPKN